MSNVKSDDVMSVISEVLTPREVSADSSINGLGVNSVLMLRLMVALQREFDVALSVADMFGAEDVGDLVRLVEERAPATGGRS
ncbi:acyl carrier protein [Actinophytocola oryzae]|uniref:Acyl carrier protein n=1 Tax=Actinophytocola oryzae TaxID=502181 RepID=A0A4R7VKL6_9PSEU|nr:acyl carrier protein [Actinophytocola oryzae]TDV49795.1 acyl carrier protein [Actinophytocola oryzae]